jgi:hypothetical protein
LEGEGNADEKLRKFLMCYRYTPSYSLGMKSPFELMTGREMKTKLDLLKPKSDADEKFRNTKMEQQFNDHHGAKWKQFELGQEVYFKFYNANKWTWLPAVIIECCGTVNYVVKADTHTGTRNIKVHANQVKARFSTPRDDQNPLMDMFDLTPTPLEVIEPLLIPEAVNLNESIYEDAESEGEEAEMPIVPLRRTARATAGVLPTRFEDYDMTRR